MRKDPMPLALAIGLLIVGVLLGSVFTFGMQYWNEEVTRESCTIVETRFLAYDEMRQPKRPIEIKEIAIDCADGERYFIDGASINTDLRNKLSLLCVQEIITLLIHPNSNTIVEFTSESGILLIFDETINKLGMEAKEFTFLGIFMYFCAAVGLYYIATYCIRKNK